MAHRSPQSRVTSQPLVTIQCAAFLTAAGVAPAAFWRATDDIFGVAKASAMVVLTTLVGFTAWAMAALHA